MAYFDLRVVLDVIDCVLVSRRNNLMLILCKLMVLMKACGRNIKFKHIKGLINIFKVVSS